MELYKLYYQIVTLNKDYIHQQFFLWEAGDISTELSHWKASYKKHFFYCKCLNYYNCNNIKKLYKWY